MDYKLFQLSSNYMNDNKKAINIRILHILVATITCILLYSFGMSLWHNINSLDYHNIKLLINIYGWIGIIIYIYILYTYKIFTGKLFAPYTIFCLFILLFNYIQFSLWSLGVHYKGELGTTTFIRYMDDFTLLKIEIVSSVSILSFHIGALISMINSKRESKLLKHIHVIDYNQFSYTLKIICTLLLIISAPVVIYDSYKTLQTALQYGYTSIYYGGHISINPITKYITYFFFPSLIGFLIGNKFSKKSFKIVSIIFGVYMLINLLAGDRGSWIYYILILYWCYITYVERISLKSTCKYILMGCILLIFTSILVKFREIGFNNISYEDFREVLNDLPYVFIKPIFEMGQSARVLGIIIQDNISETWSYGNTYIAAISSMFIPRIKVALGYPDFYLDNWISQTHLNLSNYGVGFSIIAEAYLNGGVFFYPIVMIFLGLFIGMITKCDSKSITNPSLMFFRLSSTGILLSIVRASIELGLRRWAYGVIITFIITYLCKEFIYRKSKF